MPQVFYIWSNMGLKFWVWGTCAAHAAESKHCRSFKDAHDHVNYWYLHKSSKTNVQMVGSSEVNHLQKVGERKQSCGGKKVKVQKNCRCFSQWSLCTWLGLWSSSGVEMVIVLLPWFVKLFRCWDCLCALGLLYEALQVLKLLCTWLPSDALSFRYWDGRALGFVKLFFPSQSSGISS